MEGLKCPLDKFISSVRAGVAKRFDLKTDAEIDAFFIGIEESAKDNQQSLEKRDKMLRDTVAELAEAKRLLKSAENVLKGFLPCDDDWCNECVRHGKGCGYDDHFEWQYLNTEELKKLIGEDEDENS